MSALANRHMHAHQHMHTYTHTHTYGGTTTTGKKLRYTSVGRLVGVVNVNVQLYVSFKFTSIEKQSIRRIQNEKLDKKFYPEIDSTEIFFRWCPTHQISFRLDSKIESLRFVFFSCCCCSVRVYAIVFQWSAKKYTRLFPLCIT